MRRFLILLLLVALPVISLADTTLTLSFTGDVTLGSEEWVRPKENSFDSVAAREGYDYFFKNFTPLFSADDYTVVNLEGVLSDSPAGEKTSKQYRFRGPVDFADILVRSSIESVNVSNNHSQDYSAQGFEDTKNALTSHGVHYFGYSAYDILEKDGIRIAFFGLVSPKFMSHFPGCREEIRRLKSEENVNFVVFTFHAGAEYGRYRNSMQQNYARKAIDAGADLVIMHHPHVLQGMDIYKNRSIAYSLGNFCFGGNTAVRAIETALLQVDLTFADDGTYLGQQLRIYPAHISGTNPDNNFQPVLVSGEEAEAVMKLIQQDTKFDLEPFNPELGYALQPYLPAEQ